MDKDYFSEEIGNNVSTQKDYFMEEIGDTQTEIKPKNRILKTAEDVTNYAFPQWLTEAKFGKGERNLLGDIAERPGAALRSFLMGKGYKKGAITPEEAPNLSEEAVKGYVDRGGKNPIMGTLVGMGGEVLNQVTEPVNLLAPFLSKAPGAKQAGQEVGKNVGLMKNLVDETTGKIIASPVGKMAQEGLINISNAIAAPAKFVKDVVNNIRNVKNPVQFSQNVRKVLFQQKKGVGDAFEAGIKQLSEASPDKSVDLSDAFNYIKSSIDDIQNNPGLASEIKGALRKVRNPELAQTIQTLIDDPSKAKNLTLSQSQEIKGIIQQATSIAGKSQQGAFAQYKPGDLELLDLVDEIKLAQSEVFPEMTKVRKPYAKYMGAYRVVKNKFKPGSLLKKMREGFGDEEVQEMIKVVLPQDTVKQITGFRRMTKTSSFLLKGAGVGAGLEAGRRIINKVTGD